MTGIFLLDWALIAVSIANTVLLLWLGFTVLLTAERRTWGAWVAGGGLLLAGMFFISHTAVLGLGPEIALARLDLWWNGAWVSVILLPFTWYLVILWYTGFWEYRTASMFYRQRYWFGFTLMLGLAQLGVLLYENYFPTMFLIYPVYILLNIGLSLDALRRPGPTDRVMGELARARAKPWLVATSVSLLIVGLLVTWAMLWLAQYVPAIFARPNILTVLAAFDLMIAFFIAIAILALGQAVVAYEIFTGKALPRRGFMRQWRQVILLAFGYGGTVGFTMNISINPIYSLLFSTLLMTIFFSLLSWRSYTERERYINSLRPFIASQGLLDHLMTRSSPVTSDEDLYQTFEALCKSVLGVRKAYLIAIGPLAPLVGSPLSYPKNQPLEIGSVSTLAKQFDSPEPKCMPVDPDEYGGASWAVALWNERGRIGILLLGEKTDGGLFTQEEIEIAQTSSERLMDTKASAEMASRLMTLQRQRLAESQLLDQRTRRVLHDEVLQHLHTAMLKLVSEQSKPNGGTSEAVELLAQAHTQISDLLREMPTTTLPEISKLGLIGALRKVVSEEFGAAFEEVVWNIDPIAEREAQGISSLTAEVLYYAAREIIRNAARHGRMGETTRPLHLQISVDWADEGLLLLIEDDGVGVDNTSEDAEEAGQGLALHSTMMAVVGGELALESQPGEYTRVSLTLPPSS